MKVVHSKDALPMDWRGLPGAERALSIWDVRMSPRGLRMKLLVFRNNRDLVNFWKRGIDKHCLCRHTRGTVQQLRITHENPTTGKLWLEVDPHYFAVMGLLVTHLGQEVIAHESVHAGFAYAKRLGSRSRWYDDDNEEEEVCYAAGRIASAVNQILHQSGMYALYNKLKRKLHPDEDTEVWKELRPK